MWIPNSFVVLCVTNSGIVALDMMINREFHGKEVKVKSTVDCMRKMHLNSSCIDLPVANASRSIACLQIFKYFRDQIVHISLVD